jgi:hypothetical protein
LDSVVRLDGRLANTLIDFDNMENKDGGSQLQKDSSNRLNSFTPGNKKVPTTPVMLCNQSLTFQVPTDLQNKNKLNDIMQRKSFSIGNTWMKDLKNKHNMF